MCSPAKVRLHASAVYRQPAKSRGGLRFQGTFRKCKRMSSKKACLKASSRKQSRYETELLRLAVMHERVCLCAHLIGEVSRHMSTGCGAAVPLRLATCKTPEQTEGVVDRPTWLLRVPAGRGAYSGTFVGVARGTPKCAATSRSVGRRVSIRAVLSTSVELSNYYTRCLHERETVWRNIDCGMCVGRPPVRNGAQSTKQRAAPFDERFASAHITHVEDVCGKMRQS